MKTLLVATGNKHKMSEIRWILRELDISLRSIDDFHGITNVLEGETSYRENAEKKALSYSLQTGLPAIADDSGLEIDYFNGAPGPLSARFIDEAFPAWKKNEKILEKMLQVPDIQRKARFVCVAALAYRGKIYGTFEGVLEGIISRQSAGKNGFGYDPIFFLPDKNLTLAEIPDKNTISHRYRAFKKAIPLIQTIFKND